MIVEAGGKGGEGQEVLGLAFVAQMELAAFADPTVWLMHHRRLARTLMTRRLTHETTPNWRGS